MFSGFQFADDTKRMAGALPVAANGCLTRELQKAFGLHTVALQAGSMLMLEGDACRLVYCMLDGWLDLSKSLEDGQTQIIDFALPGDIVDPVGADGATASMTVAALTDGVLAAIPGARWERMINDWPELHRLTSKLHAAAHARMAERMLRLGKGTAEMRVAYALLEFCIRLDLFRTDEVACFHVPLTQQRLGDFVGLSSVHVCRTMRRMARKGLLEMKNHMDVQIFDSLALAKLAGIDRERLKHQIVMS